jgi:lysophospholipase L1-like esterase
MTNLVKDFAIRASFAKFVIHKIEFNRKKYLVMKKLLILLVACLPLVAMAQKKDKDWADYGRYEKANASLTKAPSVVFMGNSITQCWYEMHPDFFNDNNFAGRGISGQVTQQMLSRFRADVIDLDPRAVVILAGTNDVARNNGYISLEHIAQNIESMIQLAKANRIKVILCSVLPVKQYKWRKDLDNVPWQIAQLNKMLRKLARKYNCKWVDFYKPMVDGDGGLDRAYTKDGVHPTPAGYDVMEEIIAPTLKRYMPRK